VIIVDEPELGLHPYAIEMLAALVRQASVATQVILSTQSSLLLDRFKPEDVLVADRVDGGTQLTRLESSKLAKWLEDYKSQAALGKERVRRTARSRIAAMSPLLIHVESQTEEDFVNEVFRNHLVAKGYHSVAARILGNARLRQRRGGMRPWPSVRIDILNHLREDQDCVATTMVDYCGMPQKGSGGWPGRAQSVGMRSIEGKLDACRPHYGMI
jgi:hypothetical protein